MEDNRPTLIDNKKIDETFTSIETAITDTMANFKMDCKVLKYGSTVNGLALRGNSDLDITILINDLTIDHNVVLMRVKEYIAH